MGNQIKVFFGIKLSMKDFCPEIGRVKWPQSNQQLQVASRHEITYTPPQATSPSRVHLSPFTSRMNRQLSPVLGGVTALVSRLTLRHEHVASCVRSTLRGLPFMTSAKFWKFQTPSPPSSAFLVVFVRKISQFLDPHSGCGRHKWKPPQSKAGERHCD